MNIVVDSNILFTYFWKKSVFLNVLDKKINFFALEYALEEINEHHKEIIKKTKISYSKFKKLKQELALKVNFIPLDEYSSTFSKVMLIANQLSKKQYIDFVKDIDFFALAVKLGCPIWSNDKMFKNQSEILVFNTKEIIELFNCYK